MPVALLVSIITTVPIYFAFCDLLGRYLAPRGVVGPVLTVRWRLQALGLGIPFLIDTLLVGYFYVRTGYFGAETVRT